MVSNIYDNNNDNNDSNNLNINNVKLLLCNKIYTIYV